MIQYRKPWLLLQGKRLLIIALCGSCSLLHAQDTKVHLGMTALPAIKFPFLPLDNDAYHIWGNLGLCLTTIIEGTEENTLSLSVKTGFIYDVTQYQAPAFRLKLVTNRAGIFFNPEVLFPTGAPRLKIAGGFGVEFNGYFLAQMDSEENIPVEQIEKIKDSRRKALAFLSTGIQYDLKHSFSCHLFLRQMLMDSFRGDAVLTFNDPGDQKQLKLNYIPTVLGIGCTYFF